MIFWDKYNVSNDEEHDVYVPPLIVEKYVSDSGIADFDAYSISSEFVVYDSFGQET
ncbi:MAG: hypothetical protein ACTSSE_12340 [Candidatus Thorarchaeota archaeon]